MSEQQELGAELPDGGFGAGSGESETPVEPMAEEPADDPGADADASDDAAADASDDTGASADTNVPADAGDPTAVPPHPRDRTVARKEYYSISEVCELVALRPHVLRYWETQFPVLNPSKNRSGNRVYQRKEIKLILLVKHLLYEEKFTVEGAKQKLEQLRKGGELQSATGRALDRQMVALLRSEMQYLMDVLTPPKPS